MSIRDVLRQMKEDRIFSTIANAEHESWLRQSEPRHRKHHILQRLVEKYERRGCHELVQKALRYSHQERVKRYAE